MEMNHLIGQRFNLISKSNIRYVGTLHEINPEASTIALENVMSFGSEGRRGNPAEEVPPSTSVYEYIVFRGSDVKDISIASEEQKEPEPTARVPDDQAILGGTPGPVPGQAQSAQPLSQVPPQPQGAGPVPPGYPPPHTFPQGFYPPYGQQFGAPPPPPFPPAGFPLHGGAPAGWYPPPGHAGHGFPPGHVGGFPPGPGQHQPPMPIDPSQQSGLQRPGLSGPAPPPQTTSELPVGDQINRDATAPPQKAPTPPVESKPSVAQATAPTPTSQRNGRVMPAVPIAVPRQAAPVPHPTSSSRGNNQQVTDATAAATAAVAAAMANLPQPGALKQPAQSDLVVDGLTQKMNHMRPYDNNRGHRGGYQHTRGGRGGPRSQQQHKKIEVPQSDYDFQTANAKFNKQDLVKEAIATGVPAAEAEIHAAEEAKSVETTSNGDASSNPGYNRGSSFFDNISSEARDREENTTRVGGREWRGEEEKRNMETFGQGSVDGYRPNYRGRGRGRGFSRGRGGGYSRGYGRGGRGGMRDGQASSQSTGVPSQN